MHRLFPIIVYAFLLCSLPIAANETQKLEPGDLESRDRFGYSVASDGNFTIVGAPQENQQRSKAGSAYVYRRQGGSWHEAAVLQASDGNFKDQFGWHCALDGNVAAISAPAIDNVRGAVYVFRRQGGVWNETDRITAPDGIAGDAFGWRLDMDNNVLLVGAPNHSERRGAVYVYRRQGNLWNFEQKLEAFDASIQSQYGIHVKVHKKLILVSAPRDDEAGQDAGAVYAYRFHQGNWHFVQKIMRPDAEVDDRLIANAFDDNIAVLTSSRKVNIDGLQGTSYVYEWNGFEFAFLQQIVVSDVTNPNVYGSAAVNSKYLLIGVQEDDWNGPATGAAYLFVRCGGSYWVQYDKLVASDGVAGDMFSNSIVALNNDIAVVPASRHNELAGAAYVYDLTPCQGQPLITDVNETVDGQRELRITPNPAGERIVIEYDDNPGDVRRISIYDSFGVRLIDFSCSDPGRDCGAIEIAELPAGVYHIAIVAEGYRRTARFVKY